MTTGVKLPLGAVLIAAAIGYLAYRGATSSWQYYLSVDETVSSSSELLGKQVRVSGRVLPGSLVVGADRRQANFTLQGDHLSLSAACHCLVPDNLAEGLDVVVEGQLHSDGIKGRKVITRCASKYQVKSTASLAAK